jgi:hypothetical protein
VVKLLVVIIKVDHLSETHKIVFNFLLLRLTPYVDNIIGDVGLKKSHDPVRRQVSYNILTVFGITIKIGDTIKTCSKETYTDLPQISLINFGSPKAGC